MSDEPSSRDALYVKLGEIFQASASGPLAIAALVVIVIAFLIARAL